MQHYRFDFYRVLLGAFLAIATLIAFVLVCAAALIYRHHSST